jgi:hypothetical protein
VSGRAGAFSFLQLLIAIGSGVGLMAVSNLVCDFLMQVRVEESVCGGLGNCGMGGSGEWEEGHECVLMCKGVAPQTRTARVHGRRAHVVSARNHALVLVEHF